MADNKALAAQNNASLPAYLQDDVKTKFGNTDSSDIVIPRVKLIQSVSPEAEEYDDAKIGAFWHTLAEKSLGKEVAIVPVILKKEIVLWSPRGDDRGILARSSDCINWDEGYANLSFQVKIKDIKEEITWNTKGNVKDSGLLEFGSMVPGNPDSRPAASVTYRFMFLFPDFLDLGPAIVINTRSAIKAAKSLISKIELRPQSAFAQRFMMSTTDESGDEGPYKGYKYTAAGFAEEETYNKAKELHEMYSKLDWKTNDEDEAVMGAGGSAAPATSDKF